MLYTRRTVSILRIIALTVVITFLPSSIGIWNFMPQAYAQEVVPLEPDSVVPLNAELDVQKRAVFESFIPIQEPDPFLSDAGKIISPIKLPAENCGSYALHNLLKLQGISSSVNNLSILSKTDGVGTTMNDLKQAALIKGLTLEGVAATYIEEIQTPFIAFVDGDHFILVKQQNGLSLTIKDLDQDPETISISNFLSRWDGEALVLSDEQHFAEPLNPTIMRVIRGTQSSNNCTTLGTNVVDDEVDSPCDCAVGLIAIPRILGNGYVCYDGSITEFSEVSPDTDKDGNYGDPSNPNHDTDMCCSDGKTSLEPSEMPATTDALAVPVPRGPGYPASNLQSPSSFIQTGINIPGMSAYVNAMNGGMYVAETDISTPSKGALRLHFTRTYVNSMGLHHKPDAGLGYTWTHNYAYKLKTDPNNTNNLILVGPNGSELSYVEADLDGNTTIDGWQVVGKNGGTYIESSGTNMVLVKSNGLRYIFDDLSPFGKLVAIQDRGGNQLTLTYNGVDQLIKIAEPEHTPGSPGRYLDFDYKIPLDDKELLDSVTLRDGSDNEISSVTYDFSRIKDRTYTSEDQNGILKPIEPDDAGRFEYYDPNPNYPGIGDEVDWQSSHSLTGSNSNGEVPVLSVVRRDGEQNGINYEYSAYPIFFGGRQHNTGYDAEKLPKFFQKRFGLVDQYVNVIENFDVNGDTCSGWRTFTINTFSLSKITDRNLNTYTIDLKLPRESYDKNIGEAPHLELLCVLAWYGDVDIEITHPSGLVSSFDYDRDGPSTLVSNYSSGSLINEVLYAPITNGRSVSFKENGNIFTWEYIFNVTGNLQVVKAPIDEFGYTSTYMTLEHDMDSRISKMAFGSTIDTDPTWSWVYDSTNHNDMSDDWAPIQSIDPTTVFAECDFNSDDELKGITYPHLNLADGGAGDFAIDYLYDSSRQLEYIKVPSLTSGGSVTERIITYNRNGAGNVTDVTYSAEGDSYATDYVHNALNQVTSATQKINSVITGQSSVVLRETLVLLFWVSLLVSHNSLKIPTCCARITITMKVSW